MRNGERHVMETEGARFVPVYRAPTEAIAQIVRGLLVSESIPVVLESRQVSMYDGVMVMAEGYWGDLLVPGSQADRAREIIQAFENAG